MRYVDQLTISLYDKDIFQMEFDDHPMEMTVPVSREALEYELNACVDDGILSDWLIDKAKAMVENRWSLGEISDDERNITIAALEGVRI